MNITTLLFAFSVFSLNAQNVQPTRTLDAYADTKAAYSDATKNRPILEIMYAVRGFDATDQVYTWDSGFYGDSHQENRHNMREHAEPTFRTVRRAAQDVTEEFRGYLDKGALYVVQRTDGIKPVFGEGITVHQCVAPSDMPILITYRDNAGVHTRRFEPWQNIALPMIDAFDHKASDRGFGGYFYAHQLEEVGRGLVTFTATGLYGVTMLFTHLLSSENGKFDRKTQQYSPGISTLGSVQGPDFMPYHELDEYRMRFVWGGWKGARSLIETRSYQYFDTVLDRVLTYQGVAHLDKDLYKGKSPLRYPNLVEGKVQLWCAIEGTTVMLGTGHPTSFSDFDKPGVSVLYKKTFEKFPQNIRYFALGGETAKSEMSFSDVRSYFFDKAHSFRTPAFCKEKFLHWCDEWSAPTADAFSATFTVCGDGGWIALSDKKETLSDSYAYGVFLRDVARITKTNNNTGVDCEVFDYAVPLIIPDSQSRPFWVSYNHGVLEIGAGEKVGESIIMRHVDEKPPLGVRYLCFSSFNKPVEYRALTFGEPSLRAEDKKVADAQAELGSIGKLF